MFLEQAYTGKNKWYLYLFTLLIVFTAIQIGTVPWVLYAASQGTLQTGDISLSTSTNAGLALVLLGFVVGFFTLLLCVRYIHQKTYASIITARSKIDWGRIFFSAGIWALLTLFAFALQFATTAPSEIVFQFNPSKFFVLVIVSLALFPFQTSFEELVFRGYLMQWFVLLFKYRWVAVLITGVIFGIMHSANPEVEAYGMLVALPQYILMGLILGYVAVKDDGLELALGLHMANNIMAALTLTSSASTLQTHALFKDLNPNASHTDTLVMLIIGVVFIWICNCKYHFLKKVNLWEKVTEPTPGENPVKQES